MYSTFNLIEEQCASEFESVQKEMNMQSEDFHELSTCEAGVSHSNRTPIHCLSMDLPVLVNRADIKCDNGLTTDNAIDTFQNTDNLEHVTDSEDEMLAVYFEQQNNTEKKFLCQHCCKQYKTLHSLKKHEIVHLKENSYQHSLCTFVGEDELPLEKQIYKDAKQYRCEHCQFICKKPKTFEIHLLKHVKIRHYTCDLCQKRFSLMSYLKAHILTHLETQFIRTANRHLYSCFIPKRKCVKDAVEDKLSLPQPNKAKSSSSLSHRSKSKKMYLTGSPTISTGAVHSYLPPSKRLSRSSPFNSPGNKPTKLSLSKFTKLQKRSHSKLQTQSKSHESKPTKVRSSSNSNKRKRKVNLRSFQSKTESISSRLCVKKKSEMSTRRQKHKCNLCMFNCSTSKGLKIHILSHKKDVYTCDECQFTCKNFGSLKTHKLKHAALDKQLYKCSTCEFSCRGLQTLNKHQDNHAPGSESGKLDQGKVSKNLTEIDSFFSDTVMKLQYLFSEDVDDKEEVCFKEEAVVYRCVICQFRHKDIEQMKSHLLSCNIVLGFW